MSEDKKSDISNDFVFPTIEISDPRYEHEGLRSVTVRSPALQQRADVSVWVPATQQPVHTLLILLHGVYGSHWVWPQKAGTHRTSQRMLDAGEIAPMVIAMPSDGLIRDGSAYLAHPNGEDAERWIVDEVPAVARLAAPNLSADAKIVIAGLSMGGYGALRLGAKFPERFAAISAHSAITDIADMQLFTEEPLTEYFACAPRAELTALYWLQKNRDHLPRLRFDCGVDDALLTSNRRLHAALQADNISHTFEEFPGGHEWPYWEQHVRETLRFANEFTRPE